MWVNMMSCDADYTCDYVSQDWGEATHFGRFTNQSAGTVNLIDGTTFGTGVITAANGDQLFWRRNGDMHIVATGGTGRFQNAGGVHDLEINIVGESYDGPTLILKATYTGKGTIIY